MTFRTSALAISILCLAAAAPARADDSCVTGFRAAFEPVTSAAKKVRAAVSGFANRRGRAQAAAIEKIIEEKFAAATKGAADADKDKAWDDYVKSWEEDVANRTTDANPRNYPPLEELLALMSARAPTFRGGLLEYLNDHGSVRFKVLAHFMERIPGKPGEVTYGDEFFSLWRKRINLPARRTWTPDDFALFLTMTSNALFRSLHPEPGFAGAWLGAFGDVKISDPATWKVWQVFADRVLSDYRARYTDFLTGVTRESYGEPRPDMIRDFYKWGVRDTIYRHLAAFKVALTKSGTSIIADGTGLELEDLDALNDDPLYRNLPRPLKNALLLSRNPELYKNLLFEKEVERLSLELLWATRPVIEAMILYNSVIDPAVLAYRLKTSRDRMYHDVEQHPEKYLPDTHDIDDERLRNFDEQIDDMTAERKQLASELDSGRLTPDEQLQRRKAIVKLDRRIENLRTLKAELEAGIPKPPAASR